MAAGFWIRFAALLLDGLIVGLPLSLIAYLLTGGGTGQEIFTNMVSLLYSLLLPVLWSGYTIGKRICGIRIRKVIDHMPPSIGTMLLRNVVAGLIYGITFGLAVIVSVIMVVIREDKRSIHDFIAGTQVVQDR